MSNQEFTNKNVTAVIRTVGERTEKICHELLRKQIPEGNIHIVRESPFTEALRKTFEVGIAADRKWTFVVDADVLLNDGIIQEMVDNAETLDESVFELEGKIIDKFLDNPREAGNHLYRTSLLSEALQFIPDPLESLRPETHVKNAMQEKGYKCLVTDILVGFHDFEQFYRDIYRKSFVQAKKHNLRVKKLLRQWQVMAETDVDYRVALAGFRQGNKHSKNIAVAIDPLYEELFKVFSDEAAIEEKSEPYNINVLNERINNSLIQILITKEREIKTKDKEIRQIEQTVRNIKGSYSYKIGKLITLPVSFFLKKYRNR